MQPNAYWNGIDGYKPRFIKNLIFIPLKKEFNPIVCSIKV